MAIMRETRVLAALVATDVPHPHLIASCGDPGVLGDGVFYLMEPIDGFDAGEELPALHAGDPAVWFQMGLSMADALAKLGAVDYRAVGPGDFGKPEGFLQRQVPRWLSELESYRALENYPGPTFPGLTMLPIGSNNAGRRCGRRASCTAITTPPMRRSPGPVRRSSQSSTGRCA